MEPKPHERGLTGILRDLAQKSERDGVEHHAMLKRGLTVSIEVIPSKITLRVSRRVGAPGLTEWQTCYKFLPAIYRDGLNPQPVEYVEDGRQTLSASWPPPQRLL